MVSPVSVSVSLASTLIGLNTKSETLAVSGTAIGEEFGYVVIEVVQDPDPTAFETSIVYVVSIVGVISLDQTLGAAMFQGESVEDTVL